MAVPLAAHAQQQPQPVRAQVDTPWAVSVVHTMDLQKMVEKMQQQEKGRYGVPASAPPFIYNVATGLVVDNQGHVVTRLANLDLKDKNQKISITTSDGASLPARLIGVDCATGFAVLEVAALKVGPPEPAAASSLSNGMPVMIISTDVQGKVVPTPNGPRVYLTPLKRFAKGNIGTGSIYSKARGAMTMFSSGMLSRSDSSVITTPLNQVIGIAQYAGFGRAYLYPVEFIRDTIARRVIEKNDNVRAGWLGAVGESVSQLGEGEAVALGLANKSGVIVRQVTQGSPAAASGILPNDVIIGVDDFNISGTADLTALLQSSPEGRKITLRAVRNRQPMQLNVQLGALPESEWGYSIDTFESHLEPTASRRDEILKRLEALKNEYRNLQRLSPSKETGEAQREIEQEIRQIYDRMMALGIEPPKQPEVIRSRDQLTYFPSNVAEDPPRLAYSFGFTALELTPQLAAYFKVKSGLLVRSVSKDSPAERAGIRAGDVIVGAQEQEALSAEGLRALLNGEHGNLTLKVVRDSKPLLIKTQQPAIKSKARKGERARRNNLR